MSIPLATLLSLPPLILAAGYGLAGRGGMALLALALGLAWLGGERRGWPWITDLGLVAFVGGAGLGVWLELSSFWMVLALGTALAAWSRAHFERRLGRAERVDQAAALTRTQAKWLALAGGGGLILAGLALTAPVELPFWAAVGVGLVLAFSLSGLVRRVRRWRR